MAPAQGLSTGVVESPVLVIEFERVFAESAFGRRVIAQIEAESAALAAENRRIETELTEEEQRLTGQRAQLSADDFRTLASAFDRKVQQLRSEQDAKARQLSARPDEARRQMVQLVQPILRQIMIESRAAVILERRAVIVAVSDVDVTDLVIARMDAEVGSGEASGVGEASSDAAVTPETSPEPGAPETAEPGKP